MNTNDENEWFFIIWLHHLVALDEEKNKLFFIILFIALSNGKSTKFQNQFSYFGFGVLIVSIA